MRVVAWLSSDVRKSSDKSNELQETQLNGSWNVVWLVSAVVMLDISKCAFWKNGSESESDQMAE